MLSRARVPRTSGPILLQQKGPSQGEALSWPPIQPPGPAEVSHTGLGSGQAGLPQLPPASRWSPQPLPSMARQAWQDLTGLSPPSPPPTPWLLVADLGTEVRLLLWPYLPGALLSLSSLTGTR